MPKAQRRKVSTIPIGAFYQEASGDVYFKVGPNETAWICNIKRPGEVVRLRNESVLDTDVKSMTLLEVRQCLRKIHK
jgi:hypothetical protein